METTLAFPTIVTERRTVPNQQPIMGVGDQRVAIVGEAPGEEEEKYRAPFVGKSGQFLRNLLRDVGLNHHQCFLGNVCQVRPPGNKIQRFKWEGPEIQEGLQKLDEDLRVYNPNITVLLGATALRAAGITGKITEWRGSLFCGHGPVESLRGRKCIGSLHPAFVLREFSGFPLLKFDLQRAANESRTSTLTLPQRELITTASAGELCLLMDTWPTGRRCSIDIEGGLESWPCVSIAGSPSRSHTIVWNRVSPTEHVRVLQSFARLMGRRDVPKVLQNALYDNFVLSYGFGILIRNVAEDTMLKGWECYCELPKGLGTQASIWTREPYYKFERKSDVSEVLYKYCAKDSAVTLEICEAQDNFLEGKSLQHYRLNMDLLRPLLYMQVRGIRYDIKKAAELMVENMSEYCTLGEQLCTTAGRELRGPKGSLSPKKLGAYLYDELKLPMPKRTDPETGMKVPTKSTDADAILNLRKLHPDNTFLKGLLDYRHLEGVIKYLNLTPDPDGRMRCGYNAVGTKTGRVSCYVSPTGSGGNLQTITKELRVLYTADEGYDFGQFDLAGADGWTIAAQCARLGDPTMLDDLFAGLKIAKLIVLLRWFGSEINKLDRDSLRNLCRVIDKDGWEYFACKRVQHGTNYLMGIPTLCKQVMLDSYKYTGEAIYMTLGAGKGFQAAYLLRYRGLPILHNWAKSKVVADGMCTAASGHTRIFFGRRFGPNIEDTVKEFLSHEPQNNTTYATNKAMLNLWNDPDNRVGSYVGVGSSDRLDRAGRVLDREGLRALVDRKDYGALYIEPLHQVHDALCAQWLAVLRPWAITKVKFYFNNPMQIADREITIPFEGGYGPSWGEQTTI